jgi:hypothetical protein
VKARVLFRARDEPLAVGCIGTAYDKQMHMIWHEAVRHNFKLILIRGSQNLRKNLIDGYGTDKQLPTRMCAECQGISVKSDVIEGLEMAGSAGSHVRDAGKT